MVIKSKGIRSNVYSKIRKLKQMFLLAVDNDNQKFLNLLKDSGQKPDNEDAEEELKIILNLSRN